MTNANNLNGRLVFAPDEQIKKTQQPYLLDIRKVVDDYLLQNGWKANVNSNSNYSFSGLVLHSAGSVIANYVLSTIYSQEIREAHEQGYFHIHDLTHGLVAYCSGWSLYNLLQRGFGNVPHQVDSRPAQHLDAAVLHMINFLRCTYNEFAGAQAFSSVDTYLAPFIRYDKLSFEEVKQEMQRLVFSLNVPSKWGFEMPFSNFTFDIKPPADLADKRVMFGGKLQKECYGDFTKEMTLINRAFLEVMLEGDDSGRIFTFPIPTYNLTKDFDWNSQLAELLFQVTARFGIPYFQNYIGSNLDPNCIRAMCCRLNLNLNQLMTQPGNLWAKGDSTGSIGVVTINLNRLAYLAGKKNRKPAFFKLLDQYMELAKQALEKKRTVIAENMKNGLMPYTRTYLGSFRSYFSTIGICGANEACLNLLDKSIAEPEGKLFAIEILQFMRKKLIELQKETGHLYNLEATPAESTAYRFALLDKKYCNGVKVSGSKEAPYLTNSTQLSASHTDDLAETLLHQEDIQSLYTGGTVFHTFLGEEIDWQEARTLVKKIAYETKLPYFTLTPTFSLCPRHGRIKGKRFTCPTCGGPTEVYSRIVGYFRSVKLWNKGKRQEFDDRQVYQV
ncbi:ribonucleoside triphosphate reductase [Patescibacteria group bacterium]|nr:ribonucleoside triphosphate reductase [Patescibacteria group bacterium]MBU1931595.1 ribonucleoside triphosphate reductase [Patescibacteria group bacterium]